jgi:SulP family sulfate permease
MLQTIIPALGWLKDYNLSDLKSDLTAGTIVALMLIPQGMAYAILAGLPPVMGLYASTFPLILYSLFGSSKHLAVGPVAMISLLVFTGVSLHAEPGSDHYIHLVLLLSLMVGVFQFLMGLLGAGFFINFVSHAVISGFSSAAAIIIGLSQLGHLLGIKLSVHHSIFQLLWEAIERIGGVHPITLGIGLPSIVLQVFLKKWAPRLPAPLIMVAGSIMLTYLLRLDQSGVKIVGDIPRGLPSFIFPIMSLDSIKLLLPAAMTILFVGFMESISISKLIAVKEKYKINSNHELKGLGLANMAAALFSAYPVTGGFSRTAVNHQAGARTGLASMISAGLIILILLFLTPLFYYLPNAVLASIVVVAVSGLIDFKGVRHFFKIRSVDGWTWMLTFITALILGGEKGILMGMAFSLLLFIWRSPHPHTAELGYLEKEDVFRNITRYPEAKTYPEALILRVDASLYFANMGFVEDLVNKRLIERPDVKWVIFDLSGVNDVDAVAIDTLEGMMDNYRDRGIQFLFAEMKGPVRDLVNRAGWGRKYGEGFQSLSLHHALQQIQLRQKKQ